MLPFPAIHLLAFHYLGACMEPIAVQQTFNLAVRPAGSQLPFGAFFPKRGYSLVVQRTLCDGQTDILDGQYVYRCILTNDNESDLKDIVEFSFK